MKTIQILKNHLTELGFTEFSTEHRGKVRKHKFLFNVYFPNTMHTLFFYEEKGNPDNLIIEFVSQPKGIKPFRVHLSEIKLFISQMMVPGLQLQPLATTVWSSWGRARTQSLLEQDATDVKSGLYYLGLDDASVYSSIYHRLMSNAYVVSVCVNEAGGEGSAWGAAQFRTAYSASFLNYEGIKREGEEEQMLYFLSYSYVPAKFGIQYLTETKLMRPLSHYPADMPLDLVLAIDTLNYISQLSVEDMLLHIEQHGENAVFYTYVILFSRGIAAFWSNSPRILKSKNPAVIEWLQNYFSSIGDAELTKKIEQEINHYCKS